MKMHDTVYKNTYTDVRYLGLQFVYKKWDDSKYAFYILIFNKSS